MNAVYILTIIVEMQIKISFSAFASVSSNRCEMSNYGFRISMKPLRLWSALLALRREISHFHKALRMEMHFLHIYNLPRPNCIIKLFCIVCILASILMLRKA